MKRFGIFSVMVLGLLLAASMAFGVVGNTINFPWFVNDFPGTQATLEDTWVTVKNVTDETFTVTVDYYDDSDYTTIATSDTIYLTPGAAYAYYTGKAARDFSMNNNADRGSLVLRWPSPYDSSEARSEVQGYGAIFYWHIGMAIGITFIYE